MPILPLPQFEDDLRQLQEEDRKRYEAMQAPKSLVVRFGAMHLIGEFPYDGTVKPGCGSKLVVRTHRGTELGEMLTSTCPNSGCGKSVSRQEMLRYIDNSGGRDYPFFQEGRVLRIATREDLDAQAKLEQSKHALKLEARRVAEPLRLPLKIVEVEPILGGERLTVHYAAEDRIDLSTLFRALQDRFGGRIDIKHVGPRDEARLTADYEKCGQYCCCKNFLKVLKPISMKSAKVQKATLDPLKISGRCGRLMCCLRYEDETYDELKKRLPSKKKRVGTPEGDGFVVDTQILTQLVLVRLDYPRADGKTQQIAVPVEDLTEPVNPNPPPPPAYPGMGPPAGRDRPPIQGRPVQGRPPMPPGPPRERPAAPPTGLRPPRADAPPQRERNTDDLDDIMRSLDEDDPTGREAPDTGPAPGPGGPRRRRRRRRGRGRGPDPTGGSQPPGPNPPAP